MKTIKLQYGNRDWEIRISDGDEKTVTIELWSAYEHDWMQYGIVRLDANPKSCVINMHRDNMPYAVMRALFHVVEKEVKDRKIVFEMGMG